MRLFVVFPWVFVRFGSIAPPPDRVSLPRRCTTLRLLAPKTDQKVVHGLFLVVFHWFLYYYASNPLPWLSLLRFLLVYAYTLLIFFVYSTKAPYITPKIQRRRTRMRKRKRKLLLLFLIPLLRRWILGVISFSLCLSFSFSLCLSFSFSLSFPFLFLFPCCILAGFSLLAGITKRNQ